MLSAIAALPTLWLNDVQLLYCVWLMRSYQIWKPNGLCQAHGAARQFAHIKTWRDWSDPIWSLHHCKEWPLISSSFESVILWLMTVCQSVSVFTTLVPSLAIRSGRFWMGGRPQKPQLFSPNRRREAKRKKELAPVSVSYFQPGLFSLIRYRVSGQPCGCLCSDIKQNHPSRTRHPHSWYFT